MGFLGLNEDPGFQRHLGCCYLCGEDGEVTEKFSYLGSEINVSACYEPDVNRCLGRAWGVMDSLDHVVWRCWYLCRRTKV